MRGNAYLYHTLKVRGGNVMKPTSWHRGGILGEEKKIEQVKEGISLILEIQEGALQPIWKRVFLLGSVKPSTIDPESPK